MRMPTWTELIVLAGVVGVTAIEIVNLLTVKYDGAILGASIGVISGIITSYLKELRKRGGSKSGKSG